MKNLTVVVIGILVLGLAFAAFRNSTRTIESPTASTTPAAHDLTTPDGITFSYDDSYGLAVTQEQILTKSYIPPCDSNFDYCLYRVDTKFTGTNFESAGLRIEKRTDLTTVDKCLSTPPSGYTNMTPKTEKGSAYSTSTFAPLSDAAAGHYASGALYRLSVRKVCYEFETRIGETQYANYPEGSIKKFTDADRAAVSGELNSILKSIVVGSAGTKILFP